MKSQEFLYKVKNKKIKNGTKFEVFDRNEKFIGIVGVIDSTIVYLDIENIPIDLLIGDYIFKEVVGMNENS